MPLYVVEHLDEELYPWSQCEYEEIVRTVAPSSVLLTNMGSSLAVPAHWNTLDGLSMTPKSIADLGIPFSQICLLDSESPTLLEPEDAQRFTHILIGGILGNTDEFDFDRTSVLRAQGFPTRNLGTFQMTSDTAVRVAHCILERRVPFSELQFVDRPDISANEHEALVLNFRFLAAPDGSPIIVDGVRQILLSQDDFDLDELE